jgi:hypothetical protein
MSIREPKTLPEYLFWAFVCAGFVLLCGSAMGQDEEPTAPAGAMIYKIGDNTYFGFVITEAEIIPLASVQIIDLTDDPPPPPPPTDDLAKYAQELAKTIPGPTAGAEIAAVRSNLLRVVAELEKLRDPLGYPDVRSTDEAIVVLNGLNEDTLGSRYSVWKPKLEAMAAYLDKMAEDGKIKNTVYDVAEAYATIAEGLEGFNAQPGTELTLAPHDNLKRYLPKAVSARGPPEAEEAPVMTEQQLQDLYGYDPEPEDLESFQDNSQATPENYDPAVYLDIEGEPQWVRDIAKNEEQRFLNSVEKPLTSQAFPERFRGEGKDKCALYWNWALMWNKDPIETFGIQQITGNCVEASNGDVTYTTLMASNIYLLEQPYRWKASGSSAFYMFRGHGGQGMNLGTAANAHDKYGFAIRDVYVDGKYDLRNTTTDQRFGMNNWRSQPSDFLAETSRNKTGRIARFDGGMDEAIDILYAGGCLHTGSRATWGSGNPVCKPGNVGPHAQTCFGYDARPEVLRELGVSEPIFFFDQTWGGSVDSYIKSGWREDWWGKRTRGMGILTWRNAYRLIGSTCYAYWPDLTGFEPEDLDWKRKQDARRRLYEAEPSNN